MRTRNLLFWASLLEILWSVGSRFVLEAGTLFRLTEQFASVLLLWPARKVYCRMGLLHQDSCDIVSCLTLKVESRTIILLLLMTCRHRSA